MSLEFPLKSPEYGCHRFQPTACRGAYAHCRHVHKRELYNAVFTRQTL